MNLYITLSQDSILEEEIDKLKQVLPEERYNILTTYESRGYLTVVVEMLDSLSTEFITQIKKRIYQLLNVLEIDLAMKFYYSISIKCKSKEVNSIARKKLENNNYQVKVCNSYSKNGCVYVVVRIYNVYPVDKKTIDNILGTLIQINNVKEAFLY